MSIQRGRHFLQIPGPTNVPDRILRALSRPTIDHRGPEFARLTGELLAGLQNVCKTSGKIVIYPSSGTGAWEAAVVNALSAGDKVLMFETGHFATMWRNVAARLGLEVDFIPGDWRHGVDPATVEAKLREDRERAIKAIMVVHNETSTGVVSRVAEVRKAIDRVKHPALFMVDTISSLALTEYQHDAWGIDVTVGSSQKGLMLPPGLGFNVVSEKALAASKTARLPRSYWDWEAMIKVNQTGFFPYTPPTNLFFGLQEALQMILEEGLEKIFARHNRFGEATRRAVRAWGLEVNCLNPEEYSNSVTAVQVPQGHDPDALRKLILEKFNLSLGNGLGKLQGKVFRIGHMGDFNELMLAATLGGVEMGLALAGVPFKKGGTQAAIDYLAGNE
ncbi:MAG: aminotransferase class V-fold PLP-dependent enzyme [Proteobacteria bacterium]|nr:aminotransferase class V-fold PLP-dependent enzyme [Pseudomonadota bacterium]